MFSPVHLCLYLHFNVIRVANTKFHEKEIAQLEESSDIDNSFLRYITCRWSKLALLYYYSDVSSTGAFNTESDHELTNIQ